MPSLVDSYSESNVDAPSNAYNNYYVGVGQSFTGDGSKLSSVKFYLKKFNSPTGTITAKLYAHTGTFGNGGTGTGSALATSTNSKDIATDITTNYQLIEFFFDETYTLVNGTHYVIQVSFSGGDASNYLTVGMDQSSPTHAGNRANLYYNGTFYAATMDVTFYVYGSSAASYAATLALTIGKQTASIAGVSTVPQFAASVALAIGKQIANITGVRTLPQYVASLALTIKKQLAAIEGASTVSNYAASLALGIKKQLANIAGVSTIPQYVSSMALAIKKQLIGIIGTSPSGVVYNASMDLSIRKQLIGMESITATKDTRYAKEAWESLEYVWKTGVPVFPFESHR